MRVARGFPGLTVEALREGPVEGEGDGLRK
jgi:hypothetical protein